MVDSTDVFIPEGKHGKGFGFRLTVLERTMHGTTVRMAREHSPRRKRRIVDTEGGEALQLPATPKPGEKG